MRVAHIAIAVPDLPAARAVWSRLLSVPEPPVEDLPNQGVSSCSFHLENITIELVTPLGEGSPIANYLAKKGTGIHHVAFHTDNLAATLAEKQADGFELIPPREGPGAGGMQVTFLHPRSVAGILVEFVQPPPPGWPGGAHPDARELLRAEGHIPDAPAVPVEES